MEWCLGTVFCLSLCLEMRKRGKDWGSGNSSLSLSLSRWFLSMDLLSCFPFSSNFLECERRFTCSAQQPAHHHHHPEKEESPAKLPHLGNKRRLTTVSLEQFVSRPRAWMKDEPRIPNQVFLLLPKTHNSPSYILDRPIIIYYPPPEKGERLEPVPIPYSRSKLESNFPKQK